MPSKLYLVALAFCFVFCKYFNWLICFIAKKLQFKGTTTVEMFMVFRELLVTEALY